MVDFAVPVDNIEKLKESEKKDKYLDLARELNNMKVTFIPIVIGVLGTVTKGRVETILTPALLRSARILRVVQEIEDTCSHSNFIEKPSANAGVKNWKRSKSDNYSFAHIHMVSSN